MKTQQRTTLFLFILLVNSCVVEFIPEIDEEQELLVVEGLITDQPEPYIILISKSLPIGEENVARPLSGCDVWVSDDLGSTYSLQESVAGTFVTDPANFQGVIGRKYTLHINTNPAFNSLYYESLPMELKPVPPIDSIYYEKVIIEDIYGLWPDVEGCQIYLDTHDPVNNCKFYRWEYNETWEIRLPVKIINDVCWVSEKSDRINIKNTSVLDNDIINRYPLKYISNKTDRLKVKYSILVNQYSLNDNEYLYWEKVQTMSQNVGGLYDKIPSAIPSNIWCIDDPNIKVLGYFSVSAKSSKRIFIKDNFQGIINPYERCFSDTVKNILSPTGLGVYFWIMEEGSGYKIITNIRDCVDCTTRGTNIEPLFWKDDNN